VSYRHVSLKRVGELDVALLASLGLDVATISAVDQHVHRGGFHPFKVVAVPVQRKAEEGSSGNDADGKVEHSWSSVDIAHADDRISSSNSTGTRMSDEADTSADGFADGDYEEGAGAEYEEAEDQKEEKEECEYREEFCPSHACLRPIRAALGAHHARLCRRTQQHEHYQRQRSIASGAGAESTHAASTASSTSTPASDTASASDAAASASAATLAALDAAVMEEVERCAREILRFNPSGGYCTVLPWSYAHDRELTMPELLVAVAANCACRHRQCGRDQKRWEGAGSDGGVGDGGDDRATAGITGQQAQP
jgi:hypothetical protein